MIIANEARIPIMSCLTSASGIIAKYHITLYCTNPFLQTGCDDINHVTTPKNVFWRVVGMGDDKSETR